MTSLETILAQARQRAAGQPYAGAVTPEEAFALLRGDPRVKLVDVRTNAERDWVGRVAIPDTQHVAVEWATYPGGAPNPAFGAQLQQVARKDEVLLFLCRSGCARATARGWRPSRALRSPTTSWKASRATGMRRGIARPSAGGARPGCPGSGRDFAGGRSCRVGGSPAHAVIVIATKPQRVRANAG